MIRGHPLVVAADVTLLGASSGLHERSRDVLIGEIPGSLREREFLPPQLPKLCERKLSPRTRSLRDLPVRASRNIVRSCIAIAASQATCGRMRGMTYSPTTGGAQCPRPRWR